MRQARLLWLAALAAVLVGACGGSSPSSQNPAPSPSPSPSANPSPRTTLTADEQAQLAQLEARPLRLKMPAGGKCAEGPHTPTIVPYASGAQETDVFFQGPVYAQGGPEHLTASGDYFFVTYFTDPSVTGVVLVRGKDMNSNRPLVFEGDYATGPAAGTDTLNGFPVTLHDELAIPSAAKRQALSPAIGWGVWPVVQGIDLNWSCAGIQVDTAAGTEIVYAVR